MEGWKTIQGYPLLTMSTTARRAHVATLLFLYFVRRISHETGGLSVPCQNYLSYHFPYTKDMVQIRIVNSTSSPRDSDSFRARMADRREAWNFINYSSFVEQMNNYLGCVLQWTRKWKSFSFLFCDIKHANILFQILEKLIRDWWRDLSTNWIHQRLIN